MLPTSICCRWLEQRKQPLNRHNESCHEPKESSFLKAHSHNLTHLDPNTLENVYKHPIQVPLLLGNGNIWEPFPFLCRASPSGERLPRPVLLNAGCAPRHVGGVHGGGGKHRLGVRGSLRDLLTLCGVPCDPKQSMSGLRTLGLQWYLLRRLVWGFGGSKYLLRRYDWRPRVSVRLPSPNSDGHEDHPLG